MSGASVSLRPDCCSFPNCHAPLSDLFDIPLCDRHCFKVYTIVGNYTRQAISGRQELPEGRVLKPARPRSGVVYYVRFGDRIKIGYTRNLHTRLTSVPHDEVLGHRPGTLADEKREHRRFHHLLIQGEWFRADPELLAHIAELPCD